jgi:hypothetical protein
MADEADNFAWPVADVGPATLLPCPMADNFTGRGRQLFQHDFGTIFN